MEDEDSIKQPFRIFYHCFFFSLLLLIIFYVLSLYTVSPKPNIFHNTNYHLTDVRFLQDPPSTPQDSSSVVLKDDPIPVFPIQAETDAYMVVQKNGQISQWNEFVALENSEAHFNLYAVNPISGACGEMQALPCSKLACNLSDAFCQTQSMLTYIQNRYGSIANAWYFHQMNGWY